MTGLLTTSGSQFRDWSAACRLFSKDRLPVPDIFSVVRRGIAGQLPAGVPFRAVLDDSLLRLSGLQYPRRGLAPRASGGAGARPDRLDLPGAGCGDHTRSGVADHMHLLLWTPPVLSPAKQVQYVKGRSSQHLQAEFPELRKRYGGQHMWARGYFCATVGAVDEATIKAYSESEKWDEDDQGFKITAPTEP